MEIVMICPECKKQGLKSKVYPGSSTRTLMYCPPFYDEEGRYHHHDSNITATEYSCSRGHKWTEETTGSCWCGWPEETKKIDKTLQEELEEAGQAWRELVSVVAKEFGLIKLLDWLVKRMKKYK